MFNQDTICALATPNGIGAIGMIRLSGSDSLKIISKVFSKNLVGATSHTTHFGTIKDKSGELIDEVLVTVFEQGKSFTGEESVEVSCHGSSFILQKILALILENGCRLANPGEFTQRAFLNGKMDLSQAEAVADLIASQSKSAHNIAMKQMRGGFSSELKDLREKLINFASLVELELDFAEEDVEFADRTELNELVTSVLAYIQKLAKSFELGNAIKNGVPIAIVGRPNAGKSTLLNALLNEERAIVSDIAGTTRDTIEERIVIDGIDFRFVDTAGLRETKDEIERVGVERALKQVDISSVYIYLFDVSTISLEEVKEDLKQFPDAISQIIVANKSDLIEDATLAEFENSDIETVFISAKKKESLEKLKKYLLQIINVEALNSDDTIVSNARHYNALVKTISALEKTKEGLETGVTGDFIAMDIRQAMYELGTITGDISTDDLLGNIFSKFCIGK
ncbi:MAG TPA: tRNA uridine-5-carboxymethylaminomethyl(34) synthesis GTPase MnmE [Crocinitomicaceae bacterium]|nr:tRNA uridine-5-carboxymethylaminomethyl(34) synthesis GTPase MnmE [Crocinitomicaceae bacterium]